MLLTNRYFIGAEACVQLKLYDEAKIWCHKGLAVSFEKYIRF